MKFQKWVRHNPVEAGAGALVGVLLLLHAGDIWAALGQNRALRDQAARGQKHSAELAIAQDRAREAAEIAKQRYEAGCTMVVATNDPKALTSLSVGMPVLDGVRQTPLPSGAIVCDEKGGTAVIRDSQELGGDTPITCSVQTAQGKKSFGESCPVAADYAYTGDRGVVEAAIKRAHANNLKRSNPRI